MTNRAMFDKSILYLNNIEATVRYISFEPLLEEVHAHTLDFIHVVDWVIIGAQTNPHISPPKGAIEEIIHSAKCANIPVFLKDNLYMITPKLQQMPKEVQKE